MFKDLGLYLLDARMDAMYWAHHLGCWVIILQFFFTTAPGIFIFGGGVAMEFGGTAQTIHLLYPDDATLDLMHVATMTLSHVPCGVREPSRRRADAVMGAPSRRWGGNSTPSSRRSPGGAVASMAKSVHTGRLLHLSNLLRDDPADAALGAYHNHAPRLQARPGAPEQRHAPPRALSGATGEEV